MIRAKSGLRAHKVNMARRLVIKDKDKEVQVVVICGTLLRTSTQLLVRPWAVTTKKPQQLSSPLLHPRRLAS